MLDLENIPLFFKNINIENFEISNEEYNEQDEYYSIYLYDNKIIIKSYEFIEDFLYDFRSEYYPSYKLLSKNNIECVINTYKDKEIFKIFKVYYYCNFNLKNIL